MTQEDWVFVTPEPEYTGVYIVDSNIGVRAGWYDKKTNKWKDAMKVDVERNNGIPFLVYKYQEFPKP